MVNASQLNINLNKIKLIRESQKLKRKERQDKYVEQKVNQLFKLKISKIKNYFNYRFFKILKKKKLGNFKLSKDILTKIGDKVEDELKSNEITSQSEKIKPTRKTFNDSDNEDNLQKNTISDFIPLRKFK
jgi:hypothetical protein